MQTDYLGTDEGSRCPGDDELEVRDDGLDLDVIEDLSVSSFTDGLSGSFGGTLHPCPGRGASGRRGVALHLGTGADCRDRHLDSPHGLEPSAARDACRSRTDE
jgi:hypothetical protein